MTKVYSHVQDLLEEAVKKNKEPKSAGITVFDDKVFEVYVCWDSDTEFRYAGGIGDLHESPESERADVARITGIDEKEIPIEYRKTRK